MLIVLFSVADPTVTSDSEVLIFVWADSHAAADWASSSWRLLRSAAARFPAKSRNVILMSSNPSLFRCKSDKNKWKSGGKSQRKWGKSIQQSGWWRREEVRQCNGGDAGITAGQAGCTRPGTTGNLKQTKENRRRWHSAILHSYNSPKDLLLSQFWTVC